MPATSHRNEKFYDYEGFVDKFKPKRTTDDCYTPPISMTRYAAGHATNTGLTHLSS